MRWNPRLNGEGDYRPIVGSNCTTAGFACSALCVTVANSCERTESNNHKYSVRDELEVSSLHAVVVEEPSVCAERRGKEISHQQEHFIRPCRASPSAGCTDPTRQSVLRNKFIECLEGAENALPEFNLKKDPLEIVRVPGSVRHLGARLSKNSWR